MTMTPIGLILALTTAPTLAQEFTPPPRNLPVLSWMTANSPANRGVSVANRATPSQLAAFERAQAPSHRETMGSFDVLLRHPDTGRAEPTSLDELVFTVTDDALAGVLRLDGGSWTVSGTLAAPAFERDVGEDRCGSEETASGSPLPITRQRPARATRAATVIGGPYDSGGLPMMDILAVYGDDTIAAMGSEASLRAKIINDFAGLNDALAVSNVQGRARLVGIEWIDWIDWNPSTEVYGTGLLDWGATRQELATADGVGDDALSLREQYGADVVIGYTRRFAGSVTGNSAAPNTPSASTAANAYTVISVAADSTTLAHEMGHQASLKHRRDELGSGGTFTCDDTAGTARNRFGFLYPTTFDIPRYGSYCPSNGFASVMAGRPGSQVLANLEGLLAPFDMYPRVNRFANPDINLAMYCNATGTYMVVPTGSSIANPNIVSDPADACKAEAAWRLNETWGAVADYRPARAGVDGADIYSPSPGSTVASTASFWWQGTVSPLQIYWLQVYAPATGQVFYDQMVMSSGGYGHASVSGLPTTGAVLAARLWTYLPVNDSGATAAQWTYKEFRYNSANRLVSCASETEGIAPDAAYASGTCSGCYWNATMGQVFCSAYVPGTQAGRLSAVSGFVGGDAYDLALWGQRANGAQVCCLMHDPLNAVNDVRLYGSNNKDTLAFYDASTGRQLAPYGTQAISAMLYAYGGNDLLIGSNSESSSYSETLYGSTGNDELHGGAGSDDLFGGTGDDLLHGESGADLLSTDGGTDFAHGGAGNDTLIARGTVLGTLHGDTGSDVLCADKLGVQMIGSPGNTTDWNFLYWSSTATGTALERGIGIGWSYGGGAYTWCGNTSWSTLLGFCDWATLSQAPSGCAAYGMPN